MRRGLTDRAREEQEEALLALVLRHSSLHLAINVDLGSHRTGREPVCHTPVLSGATAHTQTRTPSIANAVRSNLQDASVSGGQWVTVKAASYLRTVGATDHAGGRGAGTSQ